MQLTSRHITALVLALLLSSSMLAGTVKTGLSSRVGWVGSPLTLSIVFEDVQSHEPPVIPDTTELTITSTGPPSQFSQQQFINGQGTSSTTLTYEYAISASKAGTWEIPKINIEADGKQYHIEATTVLFHTSDDTDLMQAEILHLPDQIWLGQSTRAVLRISIKPFSSPQLRGDTMSTTDLWRQISPSQSNWGLFFDAVENLYEQGRTPPVRIVEHDGFDGQTERWYAYEITADLAPDRAGPIKLSDIRVRINYPQQIGRGRTSLFNPIASLTITSTRPVTASPDARTVDVQPPPTTDRPAMWSGAVGRFEFDVTASPTSVVVGEPITLRMRITDLSHPPADLDLLQSPQLDKDAALTSQFRVPEERPGGIVDGKTKTFTQTIRPTSGDITTIPPIPFVYFDPTIESYESAYSRPITIEVESSRTVSTPDLGVAAPSPSSTAPAVTAVTGGLLANYTNPTLLLARSSQPVEWWLMLVFIGPPVLYLGLTAVQRRMQRDHGNPNRVRARKAGVTLLRRLTEAGESPESVAAALRNFVADRLGLPQAGLTRVEAVASLRDAGHAAQADELDTQLASLEQRAYAGSAGHLDASDLAAIAKLGQRLGDTVKGRAR